MERYDAHRPRCVTPPAPRELTDETPRWNSVWSLPAEARLLDRNLDVSRRPSRWRPLWVAARGTVLPAQLAGAGGFALCGWKGVAPAVVFAVCVAALAALVLDRWLVFWSDGLSTAFTGGCGGAMLGAVLGTFVAPAMVFVYGVGRYLLHQPYPRTDKLLTEMMSGALAGCFGGLFLGGLTGLVSSFFAWLQSAAPTD
jgi:hypothetical protein